MLEFLTLFVIIAPAAGAIRFVEGSFQTTVSDQVLTMVVGCLTGGAVYWVLKDWQLATIIGVCAAVCIQLGQTKWESWKWQTIRGGAFGLLAMYLSHRITGLELNWAADLFVACYVVSYLCYYWTDNGNNSTIRPPVGKWEQWCRVIQGFCITAAPIGILIGG